MLKSNNSQIIHRLKMRVALEEREGMPPGERGDPDVVLRNRSAFSSEVEAYGGAELRRFAIDFGNMKWAQAFAVIVGVLDAPD